MSSGERERRRRSSSGSGESMMSGLITDAITVPEESHVLPEGRVLPLNSKRLTAVHLRAIAKELHLTGKGSLEDLKLTIEGKVREEGRDTVSVQAIVQETRVFLIDEEGVFLEALTGPELEDEDSDRKVQQLTQQNEELQTTLEEAQQWIADLTTEREAMAVALREGTEGNEAELRRRLQQEKEKGKQLWKLTCRQVTDREELLAAKDQEIEELQRQVRQEHSMVPRTNSRSSSEEKVPDPVTQQPPTNRTLRSAPRRGRAPPIDNYTAEDPEIRFDDWLPSLVRASEWNGWSEREQLIQLAGHLRGRALQEWNLIEGAEQTTWEAALPALRKRLDQETQILAAQDFRHTSQKESEKVADFIRRLERTFRIAYGKDNMGQDTRDALLYTQLLEGLRMDLMRSPAVSGAHSYTELSIAARSEEQRLQELKKRQQYQSTLPKKTFTKETKPTDQPAAPGRGQMGKNNTQSGKRWPYCHGCGKVGHFSRDCRSTKTESKGMSPHSKEAKARQVSMDGEAKVKKKNAPTATNAGDNGEYKSPLACLFSSSDEEDVKSVRIEDEGSRARRASVLLQGHPVTGIVDSGADITIVSGKLFKEVAAAARLKKKDFLPADKVPRTYARQVFSLDGRMDLDITFGERTMCTPVYIKMDAHDGLLLSEGVCRQLGILSYHQDVKPKEEIVKTVTPKDKMSCGTNGTCEAYSSNPPTAPAEHPSNS